MKIVFRVLIVLFVSINISYAQLVIAYDTQSLGNPKKITPHQKVEIDKIHNIAKKHNIKIFFKAIPWKRSLLLVEKGLIDGVIQASYKKDRDKYAVYPMKNEKLDNRKRLNDGNSYYIYRNISTALHWDGKKFIGEGIVAAMDKYAVIEDLKKHSNIKIKTFLNNSEIIRKLATKQIDAYAGSAKITDKLLKNFPALAKTIVRESLPIRKKDYFLIFSKITYEKKSKQMNIIWDGLKEFNQKK